MKGSFKGDTALDIEVDVDIDGDFGCLGSLRGLLLSGDRAIEGACIYVCICVYVYIYVFIYLMRPFPVSRGFCKFGGPVLGSPCKEDHSILGPILGPPIHGNSHVAHIIMGHTSH